MVPRELQQLQLSKTYATGYFCSCHSGPQYTGDSGISSVHVILWIGRHFRSIVCLIFTVPGAETEPLETEAWAVG